MPPAWHLRDEHTPATAAPGAMVTVGGTGLSFYQLFLAVWASNGIAAFISLLYAAMLIHSRCRHGGITMSKSFVGSRGVVAIIFDRLCLRPLRGASCCRRKSPAADATGTRSYQPLLADKANPAGSAAGTQPKPSRRLRIMRRYSLFVGILAIAMATRTVLLSMAFPGVPAWFVGAVYASAATPTSPAALSGVLYFLYWVADEVAAHSILGVALCVVPSMSSIQLSVLLGTGLGLAAAFTTSIPYGLAASAVTSASAQSLLDFDLRLQRDSDVFMFSATGGLYLALLVQDGLVFTIREPFWVYCVVSAAWRVAYAVALSQGVYSSVVGVAVVCLKTCLLPVLILSALSEDTRLWQDHWLSFARDEAKLRETSESEGTPDGADLPPAGAEQEDAGFASSDDEDDDDEDDPGRAMSVSALGPRAAGGAGPGGRAGPASPLPVVPGAAHSRAQTAAGVRLRTGSVGSPPKLRRARSASEASRSWSVDDDASGFTPEERAAFDQVRAELAELQEHAAFTVHDKGRLDRLQTTLRKIRRRARRRRQGETGTDTPQLTGAEGDGPKGSAGLELPGVAAEAGRGGGGGGYGALSAMPRATASSGAGAAAAAAASPDRGSRAGGRASDAAAAGGRAADAERAQRRAATALRWFSVDEIERLQPLGRGNAQVWLVRVRSTGERFAMKQTDITLTRSSQDHLQATIEMFEKRGVTTRAVNSAMAALLAEITGMETCRDSEYIVTCRGATSDFTFLGLMMELCNRGTLYSALASPTRRSFMTLGRRLRFAVQVAKAVRHAHAKLTQHGDIKSPNVFLQTTGRSADRIEDTRALLGDFGQAVSTAGGAGSARVGQRHGTVEWNPPEVTKTSSRHNSASTLLKQDVFALGQVLGELWNCKLPWQLEIEEMLADGRATEDDSRTDLVISLVCRSPWVPPRLESTDSPVGRCFGAVFDRCVRYLPKQRPTADEVVVELVRAQRRLRRMLSEAHPGARGQYDWDPFCSLAHDNVVDLVRDGEINDVEERARERELAADWAARPRHDDDE